MKPLHSSRILQKEGPACPSQGAAAPCRMGGCRPPDTCLPTLSIPLKSPEPTYSSYPACRVMKHKEALIRASDPRIRAVLWSYVSILLNKTCIRGSLWHLEDGKLLEPRKSRSLMWTPQALAVYLVWPVASPWELPIRHCCPGPETLETGRVTTTLTREYVTQLQKSEDNNAALISSAKKPQLAP